jgi:hypothetical protein
MKENPQAKETKAMKLNFYTQTTPQYVGGEGNIHFKFIDKRTMVKKMKKKIYKRRHAYLITRPLLEILNIQARKCKTLDEFITRDRKEELYNAIEHNRGETP